MTRPVTAASPPLMSLKALVARPPGRWAAVVVLAVAVLALAWAAWTVNLERACTLRQWPYLARCAPAADDATAPAQVKTQAQALRERVARNPGDSAAWIELAVTTSQPGQATGLDAAAVLDAATRLAPEDRRVQRLQAARAVQLQQWPQAVDWLVRLVQDSSDGEAALALASLVRQPQALAAMQAQITPGARWLEPVIGALPQARVPVVEAMPLVVRALALKGVSPALAQRLLRDLKAGGQWLEAHALWTAWLGRPVDLVFNGGFEQGLMDGGFDWEVTPVPASKAGALVRQPAVGARGGVLQVDFTGRPLTVPVVRQHLVLLDRRYVWTGQYMATRLRTDEGLAWALRCVADGREVARTPALKDTGGQWRPFRVELELPPDCGLAVALQLQTFAPYEALAGLRGQALFDDIRLEVRP